MIDPFSLTLLIYYFTLLCFDSTIILPYSSLTLLFFDSTIFSLFYSLTLLVFYSVRSFVYRKFFNYSNFFRQDTQLPLLLTATTCSSFREQWLRFFLTSVMGLLFNGFFNKAVGRNSLPVTKRKRDLWTAIRLPQPLGAYV